MCGLCVDVPLPRARVGTVEHKGQMIPDIPNPTVKAHAAGLVNSCDSDGWYCFQFVSLCLSFWKTVVLMTKTIERGFEYF